MFFAVAVPRAASVDLVGIPSRSPPTPIHHGAVRRGCSNQEIYPRVFSICQFLQSQREEQKPAKSFQTFLKYFRNQRLSISNLRSPRGLHHRTAEPIEDMAQCLSIGSYLKTNLW